VTTAPDCVTVAFQAPATFWSPGNVQLSVQLVRAVDPVSPTVTLALKPPPHSLSLL
jgi:hypothetical protein